MIPYALSSMKETSIVTGYMVVSADFLFLTRSLLFYLSMNKVDQRAGGCFRLTFCGCEASEDRRASTKRARHIIKGEPWTKRLARLPYSKTMRSARLMTTIPGYIFSLSSKIAPVGRHLSPSTARDRSTDLRNQENQRPWTALNSHDYSINCVWFHKKVSTSLSKSARG